MSEEEIIKILKKTIKNKESKYWLGTNGILAIQGLLVLYNKKKEDIEKFKDDKREMLIELYKANDKKYKAEKKIKELKNLYSNEKIRNTIIKRYREVIEKDYINKDKIKEKIKELKNIIEFEKTTYEDCLQYTIDILKELLEEKK